MLVRYKTEGETTIYTIDEIFGKLVITSTTELTKEKIDDIAALLIHSPGPLHQDGKVSLPDGHEVSYVFDRAPIWSEDDEDNTIEICKSTPTSTSETAGAFIAIIRLPIRTWNWCRKFVAAFLEAWRKAK